MIKVETKVCEITYIKRGGETVTIDVNPRFVEKRENGSVVFRVWHPDMGFTSVWVSARYLLEMRYTTKMLSPTIQEEPND